MRTHHLTCRAGREGNAAGLESDSGDGARDCVGGEARQGRRDNARSRGPAGIDELADPYVGVRLPARFLSAAGRVSFSARELFLQSAVLGLQLGGEFHQFRGCGPAGSNPRPWTPPILTRSEVDSVLKTRSSVEADSSSSSLLIAAGYFSCPFALLVQRTSGLCD